MRPIRILQAACALMLAKDGLQELILPSSVLLADPKWVTEDDLPVLFIRIQGLVQIGLAAGALAYADEYAASFAKVTAALLGAGMVFRLVQVRVIDETFYILSALAVGFLVVGYRLARAPTPSGVPNRKVARVSAVLGVALVIAAIPRPYEPSGALSPFLVFALPAFFLALRMAYFGLARKEPTAA